MGKGTVQMNRYSEHHTNLTLLRLMFTTNVAFNGTRPMFPELDFESDTHTGGYIVGTQAGCGGRLSRNISVTF